jgi:hypothetical protein
VPAASQFIKEVEAEMGATGLRVAFRPRARMGTIAASLATAAALLLPNAALASTQIGLALGDTVCTVTGFDSVQASSSGVSYAVPPGGTTITAWSVQAGADRGPVGLEVWRPTAPPTYTLVGSGPLETLTANSLNTFSLAITVQEGDLIGLRVEGPLMCWRLTQNPADTVGFRFGATPAVWGTEVMSLNPAFQLNVAASVEVTITPPPPPPPTPTTADQCKHGGWQDLTDGSGTPFKNQGDCVSFVATDGTNLAAG